MPCKSLPPTCPASPSHLLALQHTDAPLLRCPNPQDEMCKERPEMFVQGGVVRPGILVLVNDADWELCGGAEAVVEDGDEISFISTLHGG
jgi:hypothetical protein